MSDILSVSYQVDFLSQPVLETRQGSYRQKQCLNLKMSPQTLLFPEQLKGLMMDVLHSYKKGDGCSITFCPNDKTLDTLLAMSLCLLSPIPPFI